MSEVREIKPQSANDHNEPRVQSSERPLPVSPEELASKAGVDVPELLIDHAAMTDAEVMEQYFSLFPSNARENDQIGADSQLIQHRKELVISSKPQESKAGRIRSVIAKVFEKQPVLAQLAIALMRNHGVRSMNVAQNIYNALREHGSNLVFKSNSIEYLPGESPLLVEKPYFLRIPSFLTVISELKDPVRALKNAWSLFGFDWEKELLIDFYGDQETTVEFRRIMLALDSSSQVFVDELTERLSHLGNVQFEEGNSRWNMGKLFSIGRRKIADIIERGGVSEEEERFLKAAEVLNHFFGDKFKDERFARKYRELDPIRLQEQSVTQRVEQFAEIALRLARIGLMHEDDNRLRSLLLTPEEILSLVSTYDFNHHENKSLQQCSETFSSENTQLFQNAVIIAEVQGEKIGAENLPSLLRKAKELTYIPSSFRKNELRQVMSILNVIVAESGVLDLVDDQTLNVRSMIKLLEGLEVGENHFDSIFEESLLESIKNKIASLSWEAISMLLVTSILHDDYRQLDKNSTFIDLATDSIRKRIDLISACAPRERNMIYQLDQEVFSLIEEYGLESREVLIYYSQHVLKDRFIELLTKDRIALLFGEPQTEALLTALPKNTDERRNAFTHNDYDRTSQLLSVLYNADLLDFASPSTGRVLTEYVDLFGLARSAELFRIFKKQYEMSNDEALDIFRSEIAQLKNLTTSEEPLTSQKISEFTDRQLTLLSIVLGKSTHRFDSDRPSFNTILEDFSLAEAQQKIRPISNAYQSRSFELQSVQQFFDATPILEDYLLVQVEMLEAIENPRSLVAIQSALHAVISKDLQKNQDALASVPEEAKQFLQEKIAISQKILSILIGKDLDHSELLECILSLKLGKSEQRALNACIRQIILKKVFQLHHSESFIEDLLYQLRREVSAQSVISVLMVIDDLIKEHCLNAKSSEGSMKYWNQVLIERLADKKVLARLLEPFKNISSEFRNSLTKFRQEQSSQKTTVKMIPTNDLTGEMAGYLADVCHTAEYPLLMKWNVVPYKFVSIGESVHKNELVGSVLLFEVSTKSGEKCLLVRAFNIRNEDAIDLPVFIEGCLDEFAGVASRLGMTKVLVPGFFGAISNYPLTVNCFFSKYVYGQEPLELAETFAFNDIDLTEICYVARTIS